MDLDRALNGEVVGRSDEHHVDHEGKAEHEALREREHLFVEIYVPISNPEGTQIVGAFEFYKRPLALGRTLIQLRSVIVVGAVIGGALLYLALIGLVNRADRLIRSQHRLLVDQATLAALGEMSGAVAHGIRNPLASIRSSAELLAEEGDPARVQEASQDIIAQSDRLEAWVRELLSYTQPLDPASSKVQVDSVVQTCIDDCRRDFTQRNISLRAKISPGLPAVRADARLLGQILRSVLANAMEAVDRDGRVEVEAGVAESGEGVTVEVRGLRARPHAAAARQGGSALLHDEATRPGRGPGDGEAGAGAQRRRARDPEPGGRGHRGAPASGRGADMKAERQQGARVSTAGILIIEDEPVLGKNLLHYLERCGYEAAPGRHRREGLAVFEAMLPDAVVLDYKLPDMDGIKLLERLHALDTGARVLMMTGHGSIDLAVEAMKAGAFDFVTKPVSLSQMQAQARTGDR